MEPELVSVRMMLRQMTEIEVATLVQRLIVKAEEQEATVQRLEDRLSLKDGRK